MPKIHRYEADATPIRPSYRGFEAAMISGRRIAQIMREGNADLTRGINSFGHAFDDAEKRHDKAEAKAERDSIKEERRQDKLEAMREKAQKQSDAEAKAADKAQGLQEKLRAMPEYARVKKELDSELKQITLTTKPIDLPGRLEQWRKERVEPTYAKLKETFFSSASGQATADTWNAHGTAHIYGHVAGISQNAQGQAVIDQMNSASRHIEEDLLKNPEHLRDHQIQFNTQFKDIAASLPQAAVGTLVPQGAGTGGVVQDQINTTLSARGWTPAAIQGVLANVKSESNFDPGSISPRKEIGLYQFHPDTHKEPYLRQAGSDWKSVANQTNYMADYVERTMPGYKSLIDAPQAAREFMTGFERPKDQSAQAQEARVANLGQMDIAGSVLTPSRAAHNVDKARQEFLRRQTITAIHGVAAGDPESGRPGDPNRAREMMKDPVNSQFLTTADKDPMSKTSLARGIDSFEKYQKQQDIHNVQREALARRESSSVALIDYMKELHDEKGNIRVPADWSDRVAKDDRLRTEEKQALLGQKNEKTGEGADGVLARLANQYPDYNTRHPWMAGVGLGAKPGEIRANKDTGETTEAASAADKPTSEGGKGALSTIAGKIGSPGYSSPSEIIGRVGLDLNSKDASFLLGFVDPRNPFAQQQLDGFRTMLDTAHNKLAPRNPDGSANVTGEKAYSRFLQDYLIPQYKNYSAAGAGVSVTDPKNPEYLLKDNIMQRYSASHKDIVDDKVLQEQGVQRPDLRTILGPTPAPQPEQQAQAPQVNGTGSPPDEVPEEPSAL